MTIDYSQQESLRQMISIKAIQALGGKESQAYKIFKNKAFADLYRELKRVFQVNSYRNIATVDYLKAKDIVDAWTPGTDLSYMITGANSGKSQSV